MAITSAQVMELREKSGVGMMDCKRALQEANGDMKIAIEVLRKKGMATVEKRSGKKAADGLIGYWSDPSKAVLVEVNCETDFVAKTDDFKKFISELTNIVKDKKPTNLDELLIYEIDGKALDVYQNELIAKIGEKMGIRRFVVFEAGDGEKLAQYIHPGDKIGTTVVVEDPENKVEVDFIREVAMHIAAMFPKYIRSSEVPAEIVDKEKEIIKAQLGETNKPPEILEKIVQGKIGKHMSEVCLVDQVFVCDAENKRTVGKALSAISPKAKIKSFIRYQVGEEL